jgi:hypothetical protein
VSEPFDPQEPFGQRYRELVQIAALHAESNLLGRDRRERIATAVFAAMHAHDYVAPSARVAVYQADKLIEELDRPPGPRPPGDES